MSMTNFLDGTEVNPIPYLERDKARRDDLIVVMLAMLQDLHDGHPWSELGIDMDKIHAHVAALGIEDEVSRGAKWPCEALATTTQPPAEAQAQGGGERRDREADRARFSDAAFNDWLDTGISDAGHTVWDMFGDLADAWAGWEARQFAGDAVLLAECCGREECGGECGNEWRGMGMYRKPSDDPTAPPSAPVGVEDIIEAFDEITGLCRHLRQGGPAPEDLHGLSGALDEAIGIAGDMLAALAQAPASGEAVAPFGYCADFETGLYECSHKFYYLAPGQPVPEGCTPFYTTPPAPVPAVRVTDEMVRRASDACCVVINSRTGAKAWFAPETDDDIRRMLEAALGQGKANGS